MMNELISVFRRIAAGVLLLAACLMAATPASAQQRLSLADLQAQITALQAQVTSQQAEITALKGNSVLALNGVLAYDAANQTARFTGVDVQVINGSGPNTITGRGNLIVGYNSPRTQGDPVCSSGMYGDQASCEMSYWVWAVNYKRGSHNLVVGEGHTYSSLGGVVFGYNNAITGNHASVTGGTQNIARRAKSIVSGGHSNTAIGERSSVSGGAHNTASGDGSSVSGGNSRSAPGLDQWVAGGLTEPN